MFRIVRYSVQPYERRRGQLIPGDAALYREREDALRAATIMRRRVAGVAVYEVAGWPMQDLWREPRLIMRAGEAPCQGG